MTKKSKKLENPYVVGDMVRLQHDLKDAYGEVWNNKGSIERVKSIAKDGEGLMFSSNLGIHFSEVKLVKKATRCKCCGQVLPLKD